MTELVKFFMFGLIIILPVLQIKTYYHSKGSPKRSVHKINLTRSTELFWECDLHQAYSEPWQISKVEHFPKIVNGFKPLRIFAKYSILKFDSVLNTPVYIENCYS